jgi:hypothetical protein
MLPRPRRHELTYHGVLASGSQRRPRVIPKPTPRSRESDPPPRCQTMQRCTKIANSARAPRKKQEARRTLPALHPLAHLMRRCFDIDVLLCPHCLGRRRIIALLEDPLVVHQILNRPEIPGRALKTRPVAATATSTPSPLPDKCRANLAGPIRPRPAPTTGFGPKPWRHRYVAQRRWTSSPFDLAGLEQAELGTDCVFSFPR